MNDIMEFNYGAAVVRTVDVDGEPWFVAKDVALVLGYELTAHMTRMLDDDERGIRLVDTPGGRQEMTTISEPGLYSCIMGSRSKDAKKFKRWVTHEVLPTIRKTGGIYMTEQKTEELLADPDLIIGLAMQVKQIKAERDKAVKEKAWISEKREVTAMVTASAAVR